MMKENWVYCRGDIYCAKLDPVVAVSYTHLDVYKRQQTAKCTN